MDGNHGKFLAFPVKHSAGKPAHQLLDTFSPLVPMIAGRIARRLPRSIDRRDLEQIGHLAILDAAPRVEQFIRTRIAGAMRDSARYSRYREAQHQPIAAAASQPDLAASPLEQMVAAETHEALHQAIAQLPPDQARAIASRGKRGRPFKAERVAVAALRGVFARAA
jgi:DNA-directed RNA polymerase specialized sigma24 family protein